MNRTQEQLTDDLDAAERLDSLLDGLTGTATAGYHGLTFRRDIERCDYVVSPAGIPMARDYWEEPDYAGDGIDPRTREWEEANRPIVEWWTFTREEQLTRLAEAFRDWIEEGCKMEVLKRGN